MSDVNLGSINYTEFSFSDDKVSVSTQGVHSANSIANALITAGISYILTVAVLPSFTEWKFTFAKNGLQPIRNIREGLGIYAE